MDGRGCITTAAGGFLENYNCGAAPALFNYLVNREADPNFSDNNPQGVGDFDINDDFQRNVYNKQVVSIFTGKLPKGDQVQASLSPDYRLSSNPYDARDFAGTDRIVFRNSLILDWDINDSLSFASYSGFTDAKENTATDLGKYFVDNCRPDPADPREPQFANQICDQGDGINDNPVLFQQDSKGDTKQLSQEFRLAWDINDDFRLTQGVQYWRERVAQLAARLRISAGRKSGAWSWMPLFRPPTIWCCSSAIPISTASTPTTPS